MDHLKLNVEGHVLIKDVDTGEIILNRRNAIHRENMSFAIASAMTNTLDNDSRGGFINEMAFGNGGIVMDGSGNITYKTVNVDSITDELYNQTYVKGVNYDFKTSTDTNTGVVHTGGTTYSDMIITCTLGYDEPMDQDPYDNTSEPESDYVFDELGLVSHQGRLLSHLIFHPVQKSRNRKIQVVYTVRISVG